MAINKYGLWGIQTQRAGSNRLLLDCGIQVVGKPPDALKLNPLEFAAEYVCMELARAIRLPVADGVIAEQNGVNWYCSFNVTPEETPPRFGSSGNAGRKHRKAAISFVKNNPELACGITAFDIWTCNPDRHDKNLIYSERTGRAFIYDHGMCLLQTNSPRSWLESRRGKIGLEHSCLAPVLDDLIPMVEWGMKIRQIPEYFIRDVLLDATELGIKRDDAEFCAEFLLNRREELLDLINGNHAVFPTANLLLPLEWPDALPRFEFADGEGV